MQAILRALELKIKLIGNKNTLTNIYRIQAYDSITYRYFSIGFVDFMLNGESLLDQTNLFSSKEYEKKWWNKTKMFSTIKKK